MRGKLGAGIKYVADNGNIPAYAGKTSVVESDC